MSRFDSLRMIEGARWTRSLPYLRRVLDMVGMVSFGPRKRGLVSKLSDGTLMVFDGRMTFIPDDREDRTRSHRPPMYGGNANMLELVDRPGVRVASGVFCDGMRVVYVYDVDDDNFGYAWNLDWEDGSEWGFAPVDHPGGGEAA